MLPSIISRITDLVHAVRPSVCPVQATNSKAKGHTQKTSKIGVNVSQGNE